MSAVAAVYVRVSSHRGDDDPSTSPERQEESCRQYAASKGWTVAEVVRDLDVSGSLRGLRERRPGLERIRSLFGSIDVVIVSRIDRLARDVVTFHRFAEECSEHGASLVSVQESLDLTTPHGRSFATILASFAQLEAETIAERTSAGRRHARRAGRWVGGTPPYGYRVTDAPDGRGRVLEIDPDEAEAIREVAALLLDGMPLATASRWMNAHGPTPRRGTGWTRVTLRRVVTSETILGRMVESERLPGGKRGPKRTVRDEHGEPVLLAPPVLDLETVLALRARFEPDPSRPPAPSARSRLLSSLLSCHSCGATLVVARPSGSVVTYRCPSRAHGLPCAAPVAVSARLVEDYVSALFLDGVGFLPMIESIETAPPSLARLAEIEDAHAALMADLATDARPETFARLQALQAERADLLARPGAPVTEFRPSGRTLAEEFEARDLHGRRDLLDAAFAEIVVLPGRRGRRVLDPARIVPVWNAEEPPDDVEVYV